jgi:iron complex transport system substrate-binding protein
MNTALLGPTRPAVPEVDGDLTRRELIVGGAALGLLAACGRDQDEPSAAPPAADEPATRRFVDVTGNAVDVPTRPARIVALHDFNAGAQLLSLGVPVVGLPTRDGSVDNAVSKYFDVSRIATVGAVYSPNVEAVAALRPDLIVMEGFRGKVTLKDDLLGPLRAIAPVVGIDTFRPVDEVMADFAELLGGEAPAVVERQEADLAQEVERLRALLGARWREVRVAYLNFNEGGVMNTQAPSTVPALAILDRLGVSFVGPMVEAAKPENGGFLGQISGERLPEFDADLILIGFVGDEGALSRPLYTSLAAVRAGQVVTVPDELRGNHYPNYLGTARFLQDELAGRTLRTDLVS